MHEVSEDCMSLRWIEKREYRLACEQMVHWMNSALGRFDQGGPLQFLFFPFANYLNFVLNPNDISKPL